MSVLALVTPLAFSVSQADGRLGNAATARWTARRDAGRTVTVIFLLDEIEAALTELYGRTLV